MPSDKEIEQGLNKKDSQKREIQEEIETDYNNLIKKMDKLFQKDFGKMCPDFEPRCMQCTAHLIYNNFKRNLFKAFVK